MGIICIASLAARWDKARSTPVRASLQVPLVLWAAWEERVRYDIERGKGDHRHVAEVETPYEFVSLDRLLDDFERDIQAWSAA